MAPASNDANSTVFIGFLQNIKNNQYYPYATIFVIFTQYKKVYLLLHLLFVILLRIP